MIEVKAKYFTQRLFATQIDCSDWYKSVLYNSYEGDLSKIPFWYFKDLDAHSCQTDLTLSMEDLLKKMNKHIQKDIKKAMEMGCVFEYGQFVDEFIDFYKRFASNKGIDSKVSKDRILRYGNYVVTKMSYEGHVLAMHVRVLDLENKFAFGLYSSNARFEEGVNPQMAGRANKYLQFKDFELLKSMGVVKYDWSGVDINPQHTERHSIGEYKLAYGGEVVPSPTLYTPIYAFLLAGRTIISKFLNLLDLIKSSK